MIDLWYASTDVSGEGGGRRPRLRFGDPGIAQDVVNVLGSVRRPRGLDSLCYSLGGGRRTPLPTGPSAFRLHRPGDFNIELPVSQLRAGENELMFFEVDRRGGELRSSAVIDYTGSQAWPIPYRAQLADSNRPIGSLVQVVDGRWLCTRDGIRPAVPAYDRVVAVGDRTWRNVDLVVTFRVADVARGRRVYGFPCYGRGIGFGSGWRGHTDWHDIYPRRGYLPAANLLWLMCDGNGTEPFYLQSCAEATPLARLSQQDVPFSLGAWYRARLRFESQAPSSSSPGRATLERPNRHRAKLWRARDPEPADWQLDAAGNPDEFDSGSFVIVAHNTVPVISEIAVEATRTAGASPPAS